MRDVFSIVFIFLAILLAICGIIALRSNKSIGKSVANLSFATFLPVIGNLILLVSESETLSIIGCYTYFVGMTLMALTLINFSFTYCDIDWKYHWVQRIIYAALAIDVIQFAFNPIFGQAFSVEPITVENAIYYRLVPYIGQIYHRMAVYTALFISLAIFFVKSIRVPRIYAEKYYVIFLTMLLAGAWQTYAISSRSPINHSMIGLSVFVFLLFYFSIIYRSFQLLDRMLANIAANMSESLFFFDMNDRCIWANSYGMKFLQLSPKRMDLAPLMLANLFDDFLDPEPEWKSKQVLGTGIDAKYYSLEKRILKDLKGNQVGSFFSVKDITKDELHHLQEIYNATHDKLTGLFTKETLFKKIRDLVDSKTSTQYWIAYFDIKDFKIVNDIFGNAMGDSVLRNVAQWLRENSTKEWVYGRLGGDDFGICFPAGDANLKQLERKFSRHVISNGSIEHRILMHMGIYKITERDIDIAIMFDRAQLALTSIKNEYNKHIAFYDDDMRDQVLWDQMISAQLEKALEEKQLQPYLQPIVDNNGIIIGAEALIRWDHPREGFLQPDTFIPTFEKNGMIADIDKYVWRAACEILSTWTGEKSHMFISINISPKDFLFMDVFAEICALIEEFKVDPSRLRIEITETSMMTDIESRMSILNKFRESGFIVEMDDFGSGYSSLNQLKDMPLDVLKIDMKFLSSSKNSRKAEIILRNVLKLSGDLGLSSLTEGVETEAQYNMLNKMGCNLFQGYYFAKPMTVGEFEKVCDTKVA